MFLSAFLPKSPLTQTFPVIFILKYVLYLDFSEFLL